MKCFVCGAEIENRQFCPNCGCDNSKSTELNINNYSMQGGNMTGFTDNAQISQMNYQQYPMNNPYYKPPKQKKPINKKMIAIIAGIALIAIAAVVVILIISNRPITVELNKYVSVKIQDGYDGYGKVTYEIDTAKFIKDYPDIEYSKDYKKYIKKEYGRDAESFMSKYPANVMLATNLSGEFDKETRLSNGNVVHFRWSLNKEEFEKNYNIKLKFSDIEYTVNGLKKAETFDPFANINVKFSGIDPYGEAEYEIVKNDGINDNLIYKFNKSNGLKSGDTVKLSILNGKTEDEFYDYCIDHFGKIPESCEKAYSVELDKYVESASEIDQDTMDAMDKQARDVFEAHVKSDWREPNLYKGMTLIGNYFLKSKFGEDVDNMIYLIYRIEVESDAFYEDTIEYYYYTEFENIIIDKDRRCSVDLSVQNSALDQNDIGWYGDYVELGDYKRTGYEYLDTIKDKFIASNVDKYEYEDNIKDVDNGKLISESTAVSELVGKEVEFNGHRYKVVYSSESLTWNEAKSICENEGGHLVTITSKEEQKFISKLCGYKRTGDMMWIGLYGSKEDKTIKYLWVTGEEFEYSFWGDANDTPKCVYIDHPAYMWYRTSGGSTMHYYICEWDK
ncbi:Lectin C-type domain-containing protein [Eubacterium ruminantium]|nr:Lectin C-type domain-containing protein [Eubacterium ruminantium]